jgi:hypothetical protein
LSITWYCTVFGPSPEIRVQDLVEDGDSHPVQTIGLFLYLTLPTPEVASAYVRWSVTMVDPAYVSLLGPITMDPAGGEVSKVTLAW